MNEEADKLFEDIAEDFFAECDELLASIRRNLLKIDDPKTSGENNKPLFDDLLRSFHTLKGLAGMAGAGQIMQITHTVESYLKGVSQNRISITEEGLNSIFSSVGTIDTQLAAMRSRSELPDISDILVQTENILKPSGDKSEDDTSFVLNKEGENSGPELTVYQTHKGESLWKFFFTPSKELFSRGININNVRKRLNDLGNVLSATPTTGADGRINFEFIVSTGSDENDFNSLLQDGLTYEPAEQESSDDAKTVKTKDVNKDKGPKPVPVQKNIVRVDLNRLDDIMKIVGDLVISRARLNDQLSALSQKRDSYETSGLHETNVMMERQIRDLREEIMSLRLVPVGESFERMRFIVRDLVRESRKSVLLLMEGEDTQIDKFVVEQIFDPLLHLVRNAVSHGIETVEERRKLGKPEQGRITLRASASGDSVIFEISDDGRGIDRELIKKKAVSLGLADYDRISDDAAILDIISESGFSTRENTDLVSGRGVGMSVVGKVVRDLGGTIHFESDINIGTKFILKLPLTLSIVEALIISAGKQVFAIPLPSVNEVVRFNAAELIRSEKSELISYRDIVLPVLRLNRFFNLANNENPHFDTIVVGYENEKVGIAVDRIIGQREIVVRPLPDMFVRVDGISGATELGEGKIVLILDAAELVKAAMKKNREEILFENHKIQNI